jgi:hypothetical protein
MQVKEFLSAELDREPRRDYESRIANCGSDE